MYLGTRQLEGARCAHPASGRDPLDHRRARGRPARLGPFHRNPLHLPHGRPAEAALLPASCTSAMTALPSTEHPNSTVVVAHARTPRRPEGPRLLVVSRSSLRTPAFWLGSLQEIHSSC